MVAPRFKNMEHRTENSTALETPAAPTQSLPASPSGVTCKTLNNGLVIIVREDHSAPVVSAQVWSRTGSINEGAWLGAGLSHVLEHMLFKGTTTRGAGRIDQEVQEAGGYMNAYTSFDRTVYHINVPNTGARVAIDILCDISQNASLPPDELAKELDVIRREMDMGQDDPSRRSGRRLFEVAYTRSPYRFPIIGCLDIFNQLKPEDISAYYRSRYAPNNLFFVVTGDVCPKDVIEQIQTAFASKPAKPLAPEVMPEEPRQAAPREVIEEAPIELGHAHFSWHIPDVRHPDVPALDVLATLLGTGHSSRLYQEVRERAGVVHSVDAWTYNPGNPGLFGMSAIMDADKFDAARGAMLRQVERMKIELVTDAELGKALKQFTSATLGIRKTMQGQAQDLGGNWLGAADLNFSERYLAAVHRLTAADLQRVARTYLTEENRTIYALLPQGSVNGKITAITTHTEQAVQKVELPNGLRLLIKEDHRLPFVEMRAVFQGGVLAETTANNGITHLFTKMLLKGTARRSAEQIVAEIESVGGGIDTYGGNNSFGVNTEVMHGDFGLGFDLLCDVLRNPTFPAAALDREREVQLAGIRAQKDQLLQSAGRAMRRAIFGTSSYGLDGLGTEESIASLTSGQLAALHRSLTVPNNCVLAIYGDVNTSDIVAAVQARLGDWPGGATPSNVAATSPPLNGTTHVLEFRDKKQAVLVIGFKGVSVNNPDRYALELIQESLSDLGSRLFLRIREQLGLAYYVGAQNFLGLQPGYFSLYAGTAPEKVDLVESELLKETASLTRDGLTSEELVRAKAKVIGQRKIARQDLGSLAMNTALDELYGLGFANADQDDERYQRVTLDEIRSVTKKYLNPNACVVACVRPEITEKPAG
ncbi:MAG: insulinase family protein [Pedosphaera sp.]|nr:insulinase family protein [Pedosphaera sp.]